MVSPRKAVTIIIGILVSAIALAIFWDAIHSVLNSLYYQFEPGSVARAAIGNTTEGLNPIEKAGDAAHAAEASKLFK